MEQKILKLSLIMLLAICVWLCFKLIFGSQQEKTALKVPHDIITEAKTEAKILAKWVDSKGFSKTVAIRKHAVLSNGDISKLPVSKSVVESLRLDNLDKSSKLQQASAIIARLEAKNLRAKLIIDSLNRKSYQYHDDFANAKFTLDSLGGSFDLDWRLKLIRLDYKKRKSIFTPYIYYTDILSPDPRITISGLQNLTIESHKITRWGIGLHGGYYYDFYEKKFFPSMGLGLSYNFIRF